MALTKIKTGGIADNAITNAKMADDAIDSADFVDGSIDNAHLAGSIAVSKTLLAGGTGLTLSTNTLNVDAAQTQITSVGTLTGLTTSGVIKTTGTGGRTVILESTDNAQALNIDFYSNVGSGAGRINYSEGAGSLNFQPNQAGGATALSLDWSNNATFAGNVVINEDGETPLHIKNTNTGGGQNCYLTIENDGGADTYLNFLQGSSNGYIKYTDEGDMIFQTAGMNDRLSIDSSGATFTGNVGIGQATPQTDNSTARFLHIGDSGDGSAGLVIEDNERQWEIQNNGNLNFMSGTTNMLAIRGDNGNATFGGKLAVYSPDGWFNDDYVMHVYGQNGSGDGEIALGDFGHANNTKSTWGTLLKQHSNGFNIECRRGGEEFKFINSSRTPLHIYSSGQTVISTTDSSLQVSPLNDIISYGGGGWTSYYRHDTTASSWWMNTTIRDFRFYTNQSTRSEGVKLSNGSTSWSSISSDERLKDNWKMFDDALGKINSFTKIGTYNRIDPETKEVLYDGLEIVGLSAQEVQKVLPTAVTKHEDEEYWGLNYQDVFVLMVKAVQELSAEVEKLKENA